MKKNKGFTLIELIAVLVIMAIIALIVTPLVMSIIISLCDKFRVYISILTPNYGYYLYADKLKISATTPSNSTVTMYAQWKKSQYTCPTGYKKVGDGPNAYCYKGKGKNQVTRKIKKKIL